MIASRRLAVLCAAALAATISTGIATAQSAYPSKPITMVVSYPSSGLLGRVVSQEQMVDARENGSV